MSENQETPTFLESVFGSCFSSTFYRRVVDLPTGRALRYLVILLALISVILSLRFNVQLISLSGRILREMESQGFPTITFKDGKATSEPARRYQYQDDQTGFSLMIDTRLEDEEAVATFKQERPHVLLAHRRLILRADATGWREYELYRLNNLIFDMDTARLIRRVLIALSLVLLPLAILVGNLAVRILYALFFSGLGWTLSVLTGKPRPYRRIFHVAIYGLTLPVILDAFLMLVGQAIPYLFAVLYAVLLLRGLAAVPPTPSSPELTA